MMKLMRTMALGSVLAGVALLASCGGMEPAAPAPAPADTVLFARAAVEVGTIDLSKMAEFEVSVQRMDLPQRSQLWLKLSELHANLHDSVHPSQAAAVNVDASSPAEAVGGGCSPERCSHSVGCTPMWCCAFGEDAVFYDAGGCPVE